MSASSELRDQIINHLRYEWRWLGGGNSWRSFAELSKDLQSDATTVRREVRRLARAGVLSHGVMFDADGVPAGSGYFLTVEWERHIPGRENDPEPPVEGNK